MSVMGVTIWATVSACAWSYQLQDVSIPEVEANDTFEMIVIDYSSDGSGTGEWSAAEIDAVQDSGKLAIAYISIGEAEDYRWYWDPAWATTPPAWLGPVNPDWAGNYKVRFWDPDWQDIVFAYLDRIVAQGFDGIYMDIIDAYYFWSEEEGSRPTAPNDMIAFVGAIRVHLTSAGVPSAIVMPQNGSYVVVESGVTETEADAYFAAIDAIGVEDAFFRGDADEDNPYDPDPDRLAMLQVYRARGKGVYSIEYLTDPGLIDQYLVAARQEGFHPLIARRPLDTLEDGICDPAVGVGTSSPHVPVSASPNPFRTGVSVTLPATGSQSVGIVDVAGRVVATRHTNESGELWWDGRLGSRSGSGILAPAGSYWVTGTDSDHTAVRLLKLR